MSMQRDKSLDQYIERVRQIPVLSRAEEHEVAMRALGGDQDAAHRLVEANMRYVVAIALTYRRYGIPLADLIAEGSVGLVTAVQKFDPHRGTRFVTYAGYWIRAYILETVVRSSTMVGGGTGALRSKLYFRLRRERAQLETHVTDPDERIAILAERFDTTPERMRKMLRQLDARDVSLDAPVHDDSATRRADLLTDEEAELPDEICAREQVRESVSAELEDALSMLDPRERYIIEQRILADEEASLASLGRELGVSRERARQLEARAKAKLRKALAKHAA